MDMGKPRTLGEIINAKLSSHVCYFCKREMSETEAPPKVLKFRDTWYTPDKSAHNHKTRYHPVCWECVDKDPILDNGATLVS